MNRRISVSVHAALIATLLFMLQKAAHGQILVQNGNTIGEFNFDGTVINPALVTGLSTPQGITINGTNLYVANYGNGTIGKYNLDGTVVNPSLISGLGNPEGIVISGTNLYVAKWGISKIGKYNLDGTTVNASLITITTSPLADGLAINGDNLFVASDRIGEYKFDGTVVNASLISGLSAPSGIAISGTNLFVPNYGSGKVGKYDLDGTVVNASLISGLSFPNGIAINGNIMYVLNAGSGTVGEYNLDGTVINASLITGLTTNTANFGILVLTPPALGISTYGNQPVVFFPTTTGTNYVLQMTTNLTSGNWVTVTNGIPFSGVQITNPPSNAFFRLQ